MLLKELKLTDFRNWKSAEAHFSEGLNVLVGRNAQGKTNLVEGVFFLCTGFSPLAGREKQVISFGENKAELSGIAQTLYGEVALSVTLAEGKRKKVLVNGVPVKKAGDFLGTVNAVFFNPDELKLIKDAPTDRRRFVDIALSQLKRPYFYALATYNKILEQRNRLLKEEDETLVKETLPVWDLQLAKEGAKVLFERNEFLSALSPYAAKAHATLTGGEELLTVATETPFPVGTEEEIGQAFLTELSARYEKDRHAGFTTIGPHRDDLMILINGQDAKTFSSQGQKRTAALSLKLAELFIMRDKLGEAPIFILDDVLSELDRTRQARLLTAISGVQTFLTATEEDERVFSGIPHKRFTVSHGQYAEETVE